MLYLLSLSQLPIVLIFAYVYARDTHEREPLRLLLYSFLGGILSFIPAVILELCFSAIVPASETFPFLSQGIHIMFGVALIEEGCKLAALMKLAYRSEEFNEPFDGIIYSVAISLGMAALENALYSVQHGIAVAWVRMFSAVPLHAMCAILMGFYVGQAKFVEDRKKARALIFLGLLAACLAHGTYDYFLMIGSAAYMPLAVFTLIVQLLLAMRAMRIHNSHPPLNGKENCVYFPVPERSLIVAPVDMSVIALRLIAALCGLWAAVGFTPQLREGVGLDSSTGIGAAVLSLGLLLLSFVAARGLKKIRSWPWRLAFGIFILLLPTPAFILSLIGLFGLLHPDTRLAFNDAVHSVS